MSAVNLEQRVLVADDDAGVRTVVTWQLESAGYAVTRAEDGVAAIAALRDSRPDLVVLDLSLPGIGGLEVLRRVRDGATDARADTPVIVLSGRSAQADRITGLDAGADDYLTKPFSPGELEARVRSLLRRARPADVSTPAVTELGPLRIARDAREVTWHDRRIQLTAKEFDLLAFLAAHPRHVLTRAQLLARVWQPSAGVQGEATVTEHVHRLRVKLEDDPANPTMLRTVRGVGYQLQPPS